MLRQSEVTYRICSSFHPITNATTKSISSPESTLPSSIRYYFFRKIGQRLAVACCAIKTECPFIGVCFPSFSAHGGTNLDVMKLSVLKVIWQMRSAGPFPVVSVSRKINIFTTGFSLYKSFHNPICSVPDAETQRQHDSWLT